MSYPEKGATYRRQPKWLDKAVEAERADGGQVVRTRPLIGPSLTEPTEVAGYRIPRLLGFMRSIKNADPNNPNSVEFTCPRGIARGE